MKILVAYMSQTGNTRKVAESIYKEITGDKDIKELKELDNLEGYDFTFIGFPIHDFGPAEQAKSFMEKHANGKEVALFITHGAPEDFEEVQEWLQKCRVAAGNANIVGLFNCQGDLSDEIIDLLKRSNQPKLRSFAMYASQTKGFPDGESLLRARDFARKTTEVLT